MVNLVIPTLILSVISLVASLAAITLVMALRFSTHKVEWKTLDFDKFEEEATDTQDKDDEELLQEALNLQRKKKKFEDPLADIAETSNF